MMYPLKCGNGLPILHIITTGLVRIRKIGFLSNGHKQTYLNENTRKNLINNTLTAHIQTDEQKD